MISLRLALLVMLALVGQLAYAAADVVLTNKQFWHVPNYPLTRTAIGGVEACGKWISSYQPTWRLDPTMATQPSPTAGPYNQHLCRTQVPNGSGGWSSNFGWTATIGECPSDKPFWSKMLNACVASEEPPPVSCPVGPYGTIDVTTGYATGPGAGSGIAVKVVPDGGYSGVTFCTGTCSIKPSGASPDVCHIEQSPGANGYYKIYCSGAFERTGSQCAIGPGNPDPTKQEPEPSTPNSSPDGKCPAGSIASGQDSQGMTICVGTAKPPTPPTTTTEKPPVTTSNPDGSTTTKKETTTTNGDGSTTTVTTTTVTAPDGTKTTTVDAQTSPRPTGEAGTQDKPEDKSDLCKQNPNLNICKNSQVIGTCGQVTCSGDAIQCATLRAAAAMECKQREDADTLAKSALHSLGAAAAAGTDPLTLPGPKNSVGLAMPASLDGSGWLGGGAPFADKAFTVQGHTITIPFSQAVSYLVVFRYALMIGALLVSFRILSGAIIRE